MNCMDDDELDGDKPLEEYDIWCFLVEVRVGAGS